MDAQQAAERAAEKVWREYISPDSEEALSQYGDDIASVILAEFAPLVALLESEIERLKATTREEIERAIVGTQGEKRHSSVVSMLAGMTRDELNDVEADRDRLAAELARCHADAAETDASIRASAKRVLPAAKVDGDSTCVPPPEEVVEMLAAEVAELRKVLENCRPFLAVYVNLKQQIDAALAAKT